MLGRQGVCSYAYWWKQALLPNIILHPQHRLPQERTVQSKMSIGTLLRSRDLVQFSQVYKSPLTLFKPTYFLFKFSWIAAVAYICLYYHLSSPAQDSIVLGLLVPYLMSSLLILSFWRITFNSFLDSIYFFPNLTCLKIFLSSCFIDHLARQRILSKK